MSTQRFDIRHAPAPRESFRLLYISKSKFGGDWNSTTHTHSCTELFYCLSGEGQFYLAGVGVGFSMLRRSSSAPETG